MVEKYTLLKSKDDMTLEHNKNTLLYLKTGFSGTAGEAIEDSEGNITLFVDPRYHIQADNETKGKNIRVIKLDMKTSPLDALKTILKSDDTLCIPSKSTKLSTYEIYKKNLKGVKILPYDTEDEPAKNTKNEEVKPEISGMSYDKKIEKLKKRIKNQNIFISSLEDVSYLLNLRSYNTPNTSVIKGKLLILDNKTILFTDSKTPALKGIIIEPFKKLKPVLFKIEDEILIDKNTITLNDFNLIKNPKAIRKNPVALMSSIKTKNEIEHYKGAFKRLDNALYAFRAQIKPGLSEYRLKEIFEDELVKNGAKCTSFKTILAIDDNSSSIHYSNYDKKKIIKEGDILLLDCGGYYEGGYATDITRVFLCGKKPKNAKIKEIYTKVLKAQLNAFFKNFLETKPMDDIARKILKPAEKEGFLFPHSLGHGVGIPVHQAPPTLTVNPKYNCTLKNNMVFTIEPGLYKESEFGIRLENTVYFNKGKKITLSKFPYEESLIDKNILTKQEQNWLKIWQEGKMNE